jgi:purine-nucleoside phosphorylase
MTIHITAKKEDVAKTVIMPGDPLRAKFIAENYLENYILINDVRGMLAYTGFYKGKKVTIMASGMGNPSMGIYAHELFNEYEVENIIRIGTYKSYDKDVKLGKIMLVSESFSYGNFAFEYMGSKENTFAASTELNNQIKETAHKLNIDIIEGKIHNCDVFYDKYDTNKLFSEEKCLGVEMESYALFIIAKSLNKKAACLLTASDNSVTKMEMSPEERQNSLKRMIELALESI